MQVVEIHINLFLFKNNVLYVIRIIQMSEIFNLDFSQYFGTKEGESRQKMAKISN